MRKTVKQLQEEVDQFNERHKIGDKVTLELTSGEIKEVTVKAPASILGGHSAVGWFEEIASCYTLSRVVYLKPAKPLKTKKIKKKV